MVVPSVVAGYAGAGMVAILGFSLMRLNFILLIVDIDFGDVLLLIPNG
jgi:hypothetical protein